MLKEDALVKVSGDLIMKEELYKKLRSLGRWYNLYIICGGGSAITLELDRENISYKWVNYRRVIKSNAGRELAAKVLNKEVRGLEFNLAMHNITAKVTSPVIRFGDKICHINGDNLAEALQNSFKKVFIFTLKKRAGEKSILKEKFTDCKIVCL